MKGLLCPSAERNSLSKPFKPIICFCKDPSNSTEVPRLKAAICGASSSSPTQSNLSGLT